MSLPQSSALPAKNRISRSNGAYVTKHGTRFRARVKLGGKRVHVGIFASKQSAINGAVDRLFNEARGFKPTGKHVIIGREISLYQVKAPFSPSGKSIKGALEYDPDTDRVKCHECGDWYSALGTHAFKGHGLTAESYKLKHGLKSRTGLCSEGHRISRSASAVRLDLQRYFKTGQKPTQGKRKFPSKSIEAFNSNGQCPAQIMEKVQRLAESLGRCPTHSEIVRAGIKLRAMQYIFGSVRQALKTAGLKINVHTTAKYSEEQLLESLRTFYRLSGYFPRRSDFNRHLLPAKWCYTYRFGNVTKAWKKAGLPFTKTVLNRLGWDVKRFKKAAHGGWALSAPAKRLRKAGGQ